MEIICESRQETAYWPMFGGAGIEMTTAVVKFPVFGTTMGLSHRADDPEGMWLADWRVEDNGFVCFSHGDGDRSCNKQIAGPEIVAAILAWEG